MSAAYITSSLAKTEAVESGFDEAILLNSQGKISEASGMNIFLVRNGEIITPGFDQDILEGITRDSILTIARNLGIRTIERPVDKSELFIAEEVFISGTAARLVPVKKIENYNLPKNTPIAETLRKKLMAITENRDEQYRDWVTAISI
jgi:branched-chain amino acid aminotransferase